MMSLFARNKLLLILLGLVVLGVSWYFFSGSSDTPDLLETTVGPAGLSANPQEADLVQTLLALRAVSLSGTIFNDPAFMSLRDFGTQIIPEPVGRQNPFAPLGVSGATTTLRGR
jgi:hypothetical protein